MPDEWWKAAPIVKTEEKADDWWKAAPVVGAASPEESGLPDAGPSSFGPGAQVISEGMTGAAKSLGRHALEMGLQAPVAAFGGPVAQAMGARVPIPAIAQETAAALEPSNPYQQAGGRMETAAELIPAVIGGGRLVAGMAGKAGPAMAGAVRGIAQNPMASAVAGKVLDIGAHMVPGGRIARALAPSVMARLKHMLGRAATAVPEVAAETRALSPYEQRYAARLAEIRGTAPAVPAAPPPIVQPGAAQAPPRPSYADAAAKAEEVAAKVLELKDAGLSPGQISSHIRETYSGSQAEADRLVKMILDAATPKARLLPDGQRMMATNLGGRMGPKPAPQEQDLEELLRQSIAMRQGAK